MKILFPSNITKPLTPGYLLNFTGMYYPSKDYDRINISESEKLYNSDINTFYDKLKSDMQIYSVEDINNIANNVSKATGIDLQDVLYIMDKITSYSSYRSLKNLNRDLHKAQVNYVSNLNFIFENPENINGSSESKNISHGKSCEGDLVKGITVPLNNVFSYIGNKNFDLVSKHSGKSKNIIIFDDNLLTFLESLSTKGFERFKFIYFDNSNSIPVYLDNFENGYNFLNQSNNIEDFVISTINEAKAIPDKYGNICDKIDFILNGKLLKRIYALGIEPLRISANVSDNPDANKIAENLNPILPEKSDITSIINRCSNVNGGDISEGRNYLTSFLMHTFMPITPKSYALGMRDLHTKICEYLDNNNKDKDKVFFFIPAMDKSFSVANYTYQKVNQINNPKNVLLKGNNIYLNEVNFKEFPRGSTFIVLDDCVISGMSLGKTVFPYPKIANDKTVSDKDISIIMASLTATEAGINNINGEISRCGRKNKDVLFVNKIIPQWTPYTEKDEIYLNVNPDNKYVTSLILPYMGPDTNCSAMLPIYEKFLYDKRAQKTYVSNLDFE